MQPAPAKLWLEILEPRCVLAPWVSIGPGALSDGGGELTGQGVGPYSGRVVSLAYSPEIDADGAKTPALFAGMAGGGGWRTLNVNASKAADPIWVPLTDKVAPKADGTGRGVLNMGSIALDPIDSRHLVMGTGEYNSSEAGRGGGFLNLTKGGDVVTRLEPEGKPPFADEYRTHRVLIDPSNTSRMLASVSWETGDPNKYSAKDNRYAKDNDGLYKSVDSGKTWTQIDAKGSIGKRFVVTDLEHTWDADGKVTWFAGVRHMDNQDMGGLWTSPDGDTWTAISPNGPDGKALFQNNDVARISLAANHDKGKQSIYASVAKFGGTLLGVFASHDNGKTWVNTNAPDFVGKNGWYDMTIGLSPNGRVYLGGLNDLNNNVHGVWESNTDATAWRSITVDENGVVPHTDHHAWAFSPQGKAFAGTDGGVYRYDPAPFDHYMTANLPGTPAAVAAFDFDGKNGADFVTASGNSVFVHLNKGTGHFNAPSEFLMGDGGPSALLLGNFNPNTDATTDLAILNPASGWVSVLPSKGDGTFAAGVWSDKLGKASLGATIDADGKNGDDLIVLDKTAHRVSLLLNDGTGKFSEGWFYIIPDAGSSPNALAAADFDGDGWADVVVSDGGASRVHVFLNKAGAGFNAPSTLNTPDAPVSLVTADFKNDGIQDFAVARKTGKAIDLYINDGKGNFTVTTVALAEAPSRILATEFDADGFPDLVVGYEGPSFFRTLRGKADGTFEKSLWDVTGTSPLLFAAADFVPGSDNRPDLITFNGGDKTAYVRRYNGVISADGRGTWTSLNSPGFTALTLNSVAPNRDDQLVWLEGAHDNSLGRTADGGKNWSLPTWNNGGKSEDLGGDGGMVRFDPSNASRAYGLEQYGRLWRSDDGGKTFADKSVPGRGTTAFFPFQSKFAIDPADSKWLVLGGNDYVYMTNDRAETWKKIGPTKNDGADPYISSAVTAVGISAKNDSWAYVGYQNGRLIRTEDRGGFAVVDTDKGDFAKHWKAADTVGSLDKGGKTITSPPWGDVAVKGLALDPANEKRVYVIADNPGKNRVLASVDGGAKWFDIGKPDDILPLTNNYRPLSIATETHDYGGKATRFVYVGTDAGVFVGRDTDLTGNAPDFFWSKLGTGLPAVRVTDLVIQDYGKSRVLAAATYGRSAWKIDLLDATGKHLAAATIGGRAWGDIDGKGARVSSEPLLTNVAVDLKNSSGAVIASTLTNDYGWYQFDEVADGSYSVHFHAPPGHAFTAQDATSDDSDSDADGLGDALFTVAGADIWDLDAGLVALPGVGGSVGGRAWADADADGRQDPGEAGLANVLVRLINAATGQVVATCLTDASGNYLFVGVAPGDYLLQTVPPEGHTLTAKDAAPEAEDGDFDPLTASTDIFTLLTGGSYDLDAGLIDL